MIPVIAAIVLLAPGDDPAPKLSPEAQKELKKLEGKWKVKKLAANGAEIPLDTDEEIVGEFKGMKWIMGGMDKAEVNALDAGTNPKCIDFKSLEKDRNNAVDEGIYKLDGDTLTICVHMGMNKRRPTGFEIPKDEGTVLLVMTRVKN